MCIRDRFGCKVAIATTAKDPWVVSSFAAHNNPYDGHTLKRSLSQGERLTQIKTKQAFVDKGYRGAKYHPEHVQVLVSETRGLPRLLKKLLRGRAGIEPVIGHLKADHHLGRNHLLGKIGDSVNAVLAGCAFNLRKIIRLFSAQKTPPAASKAPAM